MPDSLEADLVRVLSRAAEVAPEPAPDLAAQLLREHSERAREKHRHGPLKMAAAAAAVLAVVAGGAVAVDRFRGDVTTPATRPTPTAAPAPTSAPTAVRTDYRDGARVDEVWPGAVRQVPAKLPNGQYYRLCGLLPGDQLLVSTNDGQTDMAALYYWTPASGVVRLVPGSRQAQGRAVIASVGTGDRWIAWQVGDALWAAPVGGAGQRIARLPNDHTTRLDIKGDQVTVGYLTDEGTGGTAGVWTVPATGGALEFVPGSANHRVLDWPWLGSSAQPESRRIWNVRTGAHDTAKVDGLKDATCSLTWCVSGDGALTAQRRNGSGKWRIPGATGRGDHIMADRFLVIVSAKQENLLYDLVAGKSLAMPKWAQLDSPYVTAGFDGEVGTRPFLFGPVVGESTYALLDVGRFH